MVLPLAADVVATAPVSARAVVEAISIELLRAAIYRRERVGGMLTKPFAAGQHHRMSLVARR
jgi:hypothetical protein